MRSRKTAPDPLFANSRRRRLLLVVLFVFLAGLLALEAGLAKHPHFAWEGRFGFYGVYGFISCVILVLGARFVLRPLVMRREEFYDE